MCVGILAGIGDRRRRARADLDRVGPIDWPTLQMLSLIAAVILVILAVHD